VAWLEVVALWVWLGSAAMEVVLVGWWCTLGIFSKDVCFGSSTMVGRVWVDD
jgi:hypothetical protein